MFKEDNGSTLIKVEFGVIYPIMMISARVFVFYDINCANHGVVCSPAFDTKLAANSTCLDVPTVLLLIPRKELPTIQSCAITISRTQSNPQWPCAPQPVLSLVIPSLPISDKITAWPCLNFEIKVFYLGSNPK